ncbi:MAG: tetratricopeptide repeat protein [Thermoguttaceae bacterium]|nr:tetratricopeptide repeat protein [Thermoguttaceae bacterium]
MKSYDIRRNERRELNARVFIASFLLALAALATPDRVLAAAGDELLAAGQSYHQNGDYANAISTLETFVAQYPNSTNRNKGELYLGCAYLVRCVSGPEVNKADTATARTHFAYILRQGVSAPFYRDALFHDARSYFLEKDYTTARAKLLQFQSEFPKDDFLQYVYYYLGVCETNVGSLDQAIAYYDRSEAEYPNSPLKWFCKLEKATLYGRKGQYAQSDQQLTLIANDSTAPSNIVGQATIQRALLMLVQNKPQDAVTLLESYIQRYRNDPSALATVQDAYLYEAYAFFAMKEYQRALNILDEVERLGSTLPVEAATVKIKLLLALKRIEEAESLLNVLANSQYGRTNPDLITSYRAMVELAKGNRDQVITSLGTLLAPTSLGSSSVTFNYVPGAPRLEPLDFVEACGVLTIAYAGRYGVARNPSDNVAQESLYQATSRYVATLNDPSISMVLNAIDKGRQAAINNAANAQQPSFAVLTPDSMYSGVPYGGDGFSQPQQNNQVLQPQGQPATGANTPLYLNQAPASNQPLSSNQPLYQNQTPIQNQTTIPNQSGGAPYLAPNNVQQAPAGTAPALQSGQTPNLNLNLPNSQTGLAQNTTPNAAGTTSNMRPALPNQQTNANGQPLVGANGQPLVGANGQPLVNANGQPLVNANGQPLVGANGQPLVNANGQPYAPNNQVNPQQQYVQPSGAAQPGQTSQPPEPTPLTPAEARKVLERATNYYSNLEFDRANEILLEAMTQSETFWTDCPAEAARIALLRANALLELDKRYEAQITCEQLVANEPNTQEASVAYYYLGALADSVGRRDEAIENLRQATSGRGDFPYADAALYCLGTNELERGDVASATKTFGRLYRDYPSSPYWSHAVWRLAKIEADMRNDVPAEKLVNEALARRPDSAIVDYLLFLKGEIALRAKDYDKALVAFDMIVDQYPNSVWYSRAKNRLATIPERFLDRYDSTVDAVAKNERNEGPIEAPLPPVSRGSAPVQRSVERSAAGLADSGRGLDPNASSQGSRSNSSVRIPSSADLRSRAAQNLRIGDEQTSRQGSGAASPQNARRQGIDPDDLDGRDEVEPSPRNPVQSATTPRASTTSTKSTLPSTSTTRNK